MNLPEADLLTILRAIRDAYVSGSDTSALWENLASAWERAAE